MSPPVATLRRMFGILRALAAFVLVLLRSRVALAAEIAALRHQLAVLGRERPALLRLSRWDRALWAFVLQRWSDWRSALVIVRPETVIAWHRKGFRLFWRWRSRAGRPSTRAEIRALIRRMAAENPIWGATRIHCDLLRLGYRVSERTVSRYLERIRPDPMRPKSQTWRTFLSNQAKAIVAVDMFAIPTIRYQVLYVFVILSLERRRIAWAAVTPNPTAFWLGQQVVNAFPWDTAPPFMICDRDGAFGPAFSARVRGLGLKELRTAFRAPKMNAHTERMIGTYRRECFDHVIVWNEAHARHLLREFVAWYNQDRTHLALGKDSPDGRPVEPPELGDVVAFPRLGGLHHRYSRRAA